MPMSRQTFSSLMGAATGVALRAAYAPAAALVAPAFPANKCRAGRMKCVSQRKSRPQKMRTLLLVSLAAALALGAAAHSASASECQFYSIRTATDELVRISTTGAVTPLGDLGWDAVDVDLTMLQGKLYALRNQVPPSGTAELRELSPIDGTTVPPGPVAVPWFAEGLAHVGGQLKIGFDGALPSDFNSERLGDLDPTTGTITNDLAYTDSPPSPSGCDFDALGVSAAGTVYSSNGIPGYDIRFYGVDAISHTTNEFARFYPYPGAVYANDVEAVGTKLFGIDSVNNQLHKIDVTTGSLDLSVPLDDSYNGLANAWCIAPLDHFTCYKAGPTKGSVKFPGIPNPPGVTLIDQFGPSIVEVKKPKSLCAPTDKNGEDPTAPAHPEHLKAYQIKNRQKPVLPSNITVIDQFNPAGIHVDVKKQSHLLVPTVKDRVTPPPLPAGFVTDHFQCYKVKVTSGTPKFVSVPPLPIADQFGGMWVDVKKPRFLCAPVDKNGESPGAELHPDHLMCYQVKQVSKPKFAQIKGVFVNNQFGPEQLDVKQPSELCVPAEVTTP